MHQVSNSPTQLFPDQLHISSAVHILFCGVPLTNEQKHRSVRKFTQFICERYGGEVKTNGLPAINHKQLIFFENEHPQNRVVLQTDVHPESQGYGDRVAGPQAQFLLNTLNPAGNMGKMRGNPGVLLKFHGKCHEKGWNVFNLCILEICWMCWDRICYTFNLYGYLMCLIWIWLFFLDWSTVISPISSTTGDFLNTS